MAATAREAKSGGHYSSPHDSVRVRGGGKGRRLCWPCCSNRNVSASRRSAKDDIILDFFVDTFVLFQRAVREIYRDWATLLIKTATVLFFSVLLALIYRDLPITQRSIQDRLGLLFFVVINQSFGPAVGVVSVFPDERVLIEQERGVSRIYSLASYFIARVAVELPSK